MIKYCFFKSLYFENVEKIKDIGVLWENDLNDVYFNLRKIGILIKLVF